MSHHHREAVTIIGAGLAGALAATLLARRGFRVELFEMRADLRREDVGGGRSINLALAARGMRALEAAGLFSAVEPLLIPMPGRMLHDIRGQLVFQPYSRNPGEVNYSVSRSGLNAVLLDAAEQAGARLHFNQRCESADTRTGNVRFTDTATGTTHETGNAPLIAADGAGSVMRRALAEQQGIDNREELLDHGYKELTIPPAPDGAWMIEREALHIWPRGGYMLIALPNTDGSFTVTLFLAREGTPSFAELDKPENLHAFFREQFPDALACMPTLLEDYRNNPIGTLGTVRCEPWHAGGNVLLLGDAAHAIVPFHGQGMNAAFEDCLVLDRLLDEFGPDWPAVFAAFSTRRKPDAEAIADMALENYVEMRDSVRDPKFHLQKAVGWELENRLPDLFIPRYEMVMFHPEIPYAEAQRRGAIQKALLAEVTAQAETLEEVDLNHAESLARERLQTTEGTE